MRLFLALDPPREAVDHVVAALGPLREAHPSLRWVDADRWHLTLAFYGEVPDDRVDRLRRRIGRQVGAQPALDLSFAGAGRFGHRVLWVGVGGPGVDALRRLGRRVSVEDKPYRPHLTVARVRERADLAPVVEGLRGYEGPPWRAGAVHLVRSFLGPRPRYEDVGSWPLTDRH
ncbi:MAG: RNA 2',3'-cyclic phosphodiesterase [Actinomycetes bacterium]